MENPDTSVVDLAQYEFDMLTASYMFEGLKYPEAVEAARREYQEIKAMSIKEGL